MGLRTWLLAAAATSLIAGCGGSGGSSGVRSSCGSELIGTTTLSGTISFDYIPHSDSALDYSSIEARPIRGATVQLLNSSGDIYAVEASDENGDYSFDAPINKNMRVRVLAELRQEGAPSWNISVRDNTSSDALYTMQGSISCTGQTNSTRDIHAGSGWNGSEYSSERVAAPFAILDTIYQAIQLLAEPAPGTFTNIQLPSLELMWSENNRAISGNISEGEIGTSSYSSGTIYILGSANNDTDEYDSSVVTHEFMHYVEDNISRSDSRGGPHQLNDNKDMRLAFSEALANAFSGIAGQTDQYRDSQGFNQSAGFAYSLENVNVSDSGWFHELSMTKIIFDIFDDDSEANDDLDIGWPSIYETLTSSEYINGAAQVSIFAFTTALATFISTDQSDDLTTHLNSADIWGSGEFGEGELNDGNVSFALPVYHQLLLGGSINACSNTSGGEYNGLGVRRFIRTTIDTPGTYRITATRTASNNNRDTDPDFFVHLNDAEVLAAQSGTINTESRAESLDPGTYIIELFDYNNTDENVAGGIACFDLQIAQE